MREWALQDCLDIESKDSRASARERQSRIYINISITSGKRLGTVYWNNSRHLSYQGLKYYGWESPEGCAENQLQVATWAHQTRGAFP